MLRTLLLLLLAAAALLVAVPFVVSSLCIGERGVIVPGRVYFKREDVTLQRSSWTRTSVVTIEYFPPDTGVASFLGIQLPPPEYDTFHTGQPVSVRYLRRQDLPRLPLTQILRDMRFLPEARLAGQPASAAWKARFAGPIAWIASMLAGVVMLLGIWRVLRLPGFAWAVAAGVIMVVTVSLVSDFPTPPPAPKIDVRRAAGKVASIGRIDRLFEGNRHRGVETLQPIDVVGVEFVPAGRADPVLAVDLIDAESVSGLARDAAVSIEYEAATPRTAYIEGAARTFAARNLAGTAEQAALYLVVVGALLATAHYLGRGYKRLSSRAGSGR
jgi:hypothetical protein